MSVTPMLPRSLDGEATPVRPGSRSGAKARDGSPRDLRDPTGVLSMATPRMLGHRLAAIVWRSADRRMLTGAEAVRAAALPLRGSISSCGRAPRGSPPADDAGGDRSDINRVSKTARQTCDRDPATEESTRSDLGALGVAVNHPTVWSRFAACPQRGIPIRQGFLAGTPGNHRHATGQPAGRAER
jgi:hypothetical protein